MPEGEVGALPAVPDRSKRYSCPSIARYFQRPRSYRPLGATLHAPEERAVDGGLRPRERRAAGPSRRAGSPDAGATPAAARNVATQSMVMASWPATRPGGTGPAIARAAGTRIPPSSRSIFCPTNGQVSEKRSPPLSLVKTTRVSRAAPVSVEGVEDAPHALVDVGDHRAVGLD